MEKDIVKIKNERLNISNLMLTKKLEDYQKKLVGMRLFAFSSDKIRADIMYSLLLENEVLEQTLSEAGVMLTDDRKNFLILQIKDTKKRQRLLAAIFNDDVIKNHVRDVLSDQGRLEDAAARIEFEGLSENESDITTAVK